MSKKISMSLDEYRDDIREARASGEQKIRDKLWNLLLVWGLKYEEESDTVVPASDAPEVVKAIYKVFFDPHEC